MADNGTDGPSDALTIPAETAFFIIVKAREFDESEEAQKREQKIEIKKG